MDKIVLVGFASSGKSTVGEILIREHGYVGLSFADALKDCLSAIFCWDRGLLEGTTKESREWRETVDPWWAARLDIPHLTPRWAMRNFGTDTMRQHFHGDIWVANTDKRISDMAGKKVVVMDGRFPNEIDMVLGHGGYAARVKRGPDPWYYDALIRDRYNSDTLSRLSSDNIHESETAWIGTHIETTLDNDGTIGNLADRVDAWIASA